MQMTKTRKPPELRLAEDALLKEGHEYLSGMKINWLGLCRVMMNLTDLNPTWTQERLGEEFGLSNETVSHGLKVIGDSRISLRVTKDPDSLPASRFIQYQLTTLPDDAFDKYCRPDVTREEIAEYKRRLAAPKAQPTPPPVRPKCPGVEGHGPGLWKWSDAFEEWVQEAPYEEPSKTVPDWMKDLGKSDQVPTQRPSGLSARDWVLEYLKFAKEDTIIEVLKTIRRCEHPDRGGSTEITVVCNKYLEAAK